MGDNLRVDTNDLRAKANQIDGVKWASPGDQPPIQWPSALQTSVDAVGNLVKAAQSVWEYQNWGLNESKRLSQALYHVGKAYDDVDVRATADINAGRAISSGPINPDASTLPKPQHPAAPGAPGKVGHASGDPEEVENALKNGDQGAALLHVAEFWRTTAANLQSASEHFKVRIQHWEGAAAEVAYGKFNDFGGWCESLAGTWQQLAGEADRIHEAHRNARDAHTPIYDKWMALKKQLETADDDQKPAIMEDLLKQYAESEHVRAQYAAAATIERVNPPEPHDGDIQTPVYTNGDPRRKAVSGTSEEPQTVTPENGQPGGAQGGSPGGTPPAAPVSPVSAGTPQSGAPPQQSPASQSGGSPSGGSGSQGGSPSGGSGGGMSGGVPAAAKAQPHLPKGPSLKPASAGGHGGGAGGGAGGGGGPLQPAVTGSAVAPSHGAATHGAQAGHAGPTAPAGAAGGGGGAPMGGQGGHGQGGKERRRTPSLSPDEEVYKEDREWTEGVIGHRKRRDVQGGKDSEGSK